MFRAMTSREWDAEMDRHWTFTPHNIVTPIKLLRRARHDAYIRKLKPMLKSGMKLRATKAECNAKEATFTFSHWEGVWIVSISGWSIAPACVYSVEGEVIRI